MARLDDYRSALLAADPEDSNVALAHALEEGGSPFVSFIVDHGLGPLWHERTERAEFHESRLSAEALYLAQEHALGEIDTVLDGAGIEYAVIKGAATRLLLFPNPAIRACHDIDLLVRPEERVRAASGLVAAGFTAVPDTLNISHELVLSRSVVDIDLHWGLLREGRLRADYAATLLSRRQRSKKIWMLNAEDAFFVLLVHPAFAKHLAGWNMGLHRVLDILAWMRTKSFDWPAVCEILKKNGVRTAAWATLRWVELLTAPNTPAGLDAMLSDIRPGR
ncbi:MAG: nucleotidyltransferase family protein, partial [Gammaproteobacteria bacterium]|nr:nucleotidyltransferase family protein [Gammaproteobacteria bacterium]